MTTEFKLPELGENIESGDIVNVLVREGQVIDAEQPVLEIETDKAVVEIPCSVAGKITKVHVTKGDTVAVGQTLLSVDAAAPAGDAPKPKAAPAPAATTTTPTPVATPVPQPEPVTTGPIPAGPAARRVARELGVDLHGIAGSGKQGRITPEDVQAAAASGATASVGPQAVVPPGEAGEDAWGPVRRERMSKIRRTIAAQMVRSASTIPHVTNFDDADVTDLEHLRKGVPVGYLDEGIKLTSMPFVFKAVALSLRQHPMLNARLDEENNQIVYKEYVNLGVAVDTPRGLVVPVVRGVDRMSLVEIAQAIASVAQRARDVRFAIEDLRGGTFTISNLGAVGGTYSTPIINHPEVAILLLGRSRWMPVVRDGAVETRLMMPLSLSYDHRLVDGAAAARFLNEVIDFLQSPGKLLLA